MLIALTYLLALEGDGGEEEPAVSLQLDRP
jgi:hypothetical protein